MKLSRDDIIECPTCIDKIDLFLISPLFVRPYDHSFYERFGIDKKVLTKNTREYIHKNSHMEGVGKSLREVYHNIEKVRKSGKPSFSWVSDYFKQCRATRVKFQGYDRFVVRVIGNPTRFMREHYESNGGIDTDLDMKYRIHDNNYLYPEIMAEKLSIPEFQKELMKYLPDISKIGKYVTEDVLDAGKFSTKGFGMELMGKYDELNKIQNSLDRDMLKEKYYSGIYWKSTLQYCEVNRDLMFDNPIAVDVMKQLVDFFTTERGKEYYSEYGVLGCYTRDFREYGNIQILLQLPNGYGKLKLYCKTRYTIRREVCITPHELLLKLKSKDYSFLTGKDNEKLFWDVIVKPAFNIVDVIGIIAGDIDVHSNYVPNLMVKHAKITDKERIFWEAVLNNRLLKTEEIPDYLRKLVKMRWVYSKHAGRSVRRYELKPEYKEKYGVVEKW